MFLRRPVQGFTLIEVMVAVGIIVIMMGIVMMSISEARKGSRDKQRVADLAQVEFALNLYKEKNRQYPIYDTGVEIGVGEPIDAELAQFWPGLRPDPKNTGSNTTYGYWYQSDFECAGASRVVVIARTMERETSSNYEEVCGAVALPHKKINLFAWLVSTAEAGGGGGYSEGSYYSEAGYYSQAEYYSESAYYSQGLYSGAYSQSAYYSQGGYSSQELNLTNEELVSSYIVIIN